MTLVVPEHLHRVYCECAGPSFAIPFHGGLAYPWLQFGLRFTEDDLRLVIRWIKGRQKLNKPARSLVFRNFIKGPDSLDSFDEDLCQARAESRTLRVDPGKAQVLRATGRPVTTVGHDAESAKDAFERTKLAQMLHEWKEKPL